MPADELPQTLAELRVGAVQREGDEGVPRALEPVEQPLLHGDQVLGVGVVVHVPHQECATCREPLGTRLRDVAVLGDQRLDPGTRLVADTGQPVDDQRDRLARDVREPGDVPHGQAPLAPVDRRRCLAVVCHGVLPSSRRRVQSAQKYATTVRDRSVCTGREGMPEGRRNRWGQRPLVVLPRSCRRAARLPSHLRPGLA